MDTNDVVIRPPRPHDARGLAETHIAAWRAAYRGVMSEAFLDGLDVERREAAWRRAIAAPPEGTVPLVADMAGQIAGFVIVGSPEDEAIQNGADNGAGQLYAINLHPDHWRQGIGTLLLQAAEERLRDLKYGSAYLWVEQSNERAIAFYDRYGWASDGGSKVDDAYSPPITARRYRKVLG